MISTSEGPATAETLELDAQHHSLLFKPDMVFERGEGVWLFDADGRTYLDCMAGIAVASLGHAHPRLSAAIAAQAGKLLVAPQNMGNSVRARFAEKLFQFVDAPLSRVFLSNSGAEANEAALKWARVKTGRRKFIALEHGFSGRTMGVLPLTWEHAYREPFGPYSFEVTFVTPGDESALAAAVDSDTAAVLFEPIQGESGVRPLPHSFMRAARELTLKRGALLIIDEIQTGVGRTGTFLASAESGVTPDIVTLAKGLAGGVPIGATLMTDEVAAAMPRGGHGTTFGGNPLAAAAGLAVLEELEESGLMSRARQLGERLMGGLLASGSGVVTEVRGRGLLIGAQVRAPVQDVIAALKGEGVLTIQGGSDTVRYLPPLVISEDEVDEVVKRSEKAFTKVAAAL